MSLNIFKNKLYNSIIAISLVVAIVVVTSFVPEMLEKRKEQRIQASEDFLYEEPQMKVESARKSQELSNSVEILKKASSKEEIIDGLTELDESLYDVEKTIQEEVREAKKKGVSRKIQERAEAQEKKTVDGIRRISNKVKSLSAEVDSLSEEELKSEIKKIRKEIRGLQTTKTPEAPCKENSHGIVKSCQAGKIVGEEAVPSLFEGVADASKTDDVSYLILNDEIKTLADSFENPVQIYEYVRNHYQYKQYTGLRLGANGAYEQKAGNDHDLATLLIALFRYKGYEAKYVTGNIDIDIEKAMNWLGVNTKEAAVDAMSMLGIPTQYGCDPYGNVTKIRIEHTWVKVKVPYDSYRGSGKVKGKKIWVELDPSFKQYEDESDNPFKEFLYAKAGTLRDMFMEEGTTESLPQETMEQMYSKFSEDIMEYVRNHDVSNEDVGMALGYRFIKQEVLGYLPNSLPYSVVGECHESEYLPEEVKSCVSFSLEEALYGKVFSGTKENTVKFYTYDLYGHKVTFDYIPATEEDKRLIESYGGIYETPAYLVRICPAVKIDGNVALKGTAQIPGSFVELTMNINEAGVDAVTVENPLVAGGSYAVTFDYGTVRAATLSHSNEQLKRYAELLKSDEGALGDARAAYLCTMGENYWAILDILDTAVASVSGVRVARSISESITGIEPEVASIFGAPVGIKDGSLFIDVDTDTVGLVCEGEEGFSSDEKGKTVRSYMLTSGMIGSYLEGVAVETMTGSKGVSTISVLQTASARGIDILTLTEEDDILLEELDLDKTAKKNIETALHNGKTVIVPEKDICYYEWKGTGYMVVTPETGEAAYMISGGLCGGSDSSKFLFNNVIGFSNCLLQGAFAVDTIMMIVAGVEAFLAAEALAPAIIACVVVVVAEILLVVVIMALIEAILNWMMYYITGNEKYSDAFTIDFIMSVIVYGVFKVCFKGLKLVFEWFDVRIRGYGTADGGGSDSGGSFGGDSSAGSGSDGFGSDGSGSDGFGTEGGGHEGSGSEGGQGNDSYGTAGSELEGGAGNGSGDINGGNTEGHGGDGTSGEPGGKNGGDKGSGTNSTLNRDYWAGVAKKYGVDIARKFEAFGEQGKQVLEAYGDRAVSAVKNLSDADSAKAIQLMIEYGESAVELLNKGYSVGSVRNVIEGGSKTINDLTPNQGYSSFKDLKKNIGSAGDGNDWHHIVEQSQIKKSGFSPEQIHNTNNIIAVDHATHMRITGYYNTKSFDFTNGLSVRDWLAGQSYEEQYSFGLDVLKRFGVIE